MRCDADCLVRVVAGFTAVMVVGGVTLLILCVLWGTA